MKSIFFHLTVLCLFTPLLSCSLNANEQNTEEVTLAGMPDESFVTEVDVAQVQVKKFIFRQQLNGKIYAARATDLYWETSGIIEKLLVSNGSRIAKGQLLAVLANENEKIQLEKAKIALDEARINYESEVLGTATDSVRQKNIYIGSGMAAAKVAFKEAQINYEKTKVYAPFNGLIANLQVDAGNLVRQGDVLAHIFDNTELEFRGKVMETALTNLEIGQGAKISPLGSKAPYAGKVVEINPVVDENGLVEIIVKLEKTGQLLPGQTAMASINIPFEKNIIVPTEAVVLRSGKAVVFTLEEGLAKWHYVTTGMENGEVIEIIEGLDEGDTVITSNNLQLAHDARVKPIIPYAENR